MPNKTLRGEDSSEVIYLYDSLEEALTIAREEFLAAKKAVEKADATGLIENLSRKEKTLKESTLAMEWFLDEYNIERSK